MDPLQSEEVSHAPAAAADDVNACSGNDSCNKSQNDEMPIPKLEHNLGSGDSGSSVEDEVSITWGVYKSGWWLHLLSSLGATYKIVSLDTYSHAYINKTFLLFLDF